MIRAPGHPDDARPRKHQESRCRLQGQALNSDQNTNISSR